MPTPQTEFRYPCENCGASLRFAPGQRVLTCDHCGHVQQIGSGLARAPSRQPGGGVEAEAILNRDPGTGRALQWDAGHKAPTLEEIPLQDGLRLDAQSDLTAVIRTVSCPNCGARLELSSTLQASECPFCATPVVTDTGTTRLIKPQGILPFVLTEEQARAALGDWLRGLWFAPSGLRQYARRNRRMVGVYSPFWTFDADSRTTYRGQRGDAYYETVYVTRQIDGRMQQVPTQVRRIAWTRVSGQVARDFDDVLVLASSSLPRRFTDSLTPWDLSQLTPYRPEYVAGLEAEGYTVPLAEGHQVCRQQMADVITMDVRRAIGGDEQQIEALETDFSAETFKHILLPIWSAAYRYNGASYRFVVNGQTGRVEGERPYSAWKIAFAVIAALLAAALALWLAQQAGFIQFGGDAGYSGGFGTSYDSFPTPGSSGTFLPVPDNGGYVIRGY
ncbi:zinc ribbon domain-containing protein [Paracoccus suum]|uniref:zinc ribbon domain-containing protein n=1 Tax=Paracoccus suum TaxID=2259340 RepID=UPI001F541864|nr:zinc ribbon domain-containing protein [Paracoccus suum]